VPRACDTDAIENHSESGLSDNSFEDDNDSQNACGVSAAKVRSQGAQMRTALRIADIDESQRPRERSVALGAGALSDAELLAVQREPALQE
jgi:hypothetical protein